VGDNDLDDSFPNTGPAHDCPVFIEARSAADLFAPNPWWKVVEGELRVHLDLRAS